MKNPQPTAAQAAAFILAAYELKEKLSDKVEINIEVGALGYSMSFFRLNEDKKKCVGWAHAFYSLFTTENALTDEQNAQAIRACVNQAHETITAIGGFATK